MEEVLEEGFVEFEFFNEEQDAVNKKSKTTSVERKKERSLMSFLI
jgi:hypothetical protein